MGSTTNLNIKSYNGIDTEDIILWLEEMTMCQQIFRWDELSEKRMIIVHLKGDARAWMAKFLNEKGYEISTQVLKTELQKRFLSKGRTDVTLSSFIHAQAQKNREEFNPLLRTATVLASKGMMSHEAMCQIIINKVPEAFKVFLIQTMETRETSKELLNRDDSSCWIAFPDPMLNRIEAEQSKTETASLKMNCLLHGENTHSTEQCFRIIAFVKQQRQKKEQWVQKKQS
ncbi:transposable element, partial [Pseudoloma neurophilia]